LILQSSLQALRGEMEARFAAQAEAEQQRAAAEQQRLSAAVQVREH